MRVGFWLVLLAAASGVAFAAEDPTESLPGVLDLTPETFDKYVNGGKHALVEFYAPWCGHCKHLTPEYKKLGAAVAASPKLKNSVVVAKVDADAHRSLGERFGVTGFPTIKFFSRGKPVATPTDYASGRTAEAFQTYLEDAVTSDKGFARLPSLDEFASQFSTSKDLKTLLKDAQAAVGKLTDDTQKSAGDVYMKVMRKAQEKGSDYFQTESARLERLLESGKVGASKLGEISQKLSVLSAFSKEDEATRSEE